MSTDVGRCRSTSIDVDRRRHVVEAPKGLSKCRRRHRSTLAMSPTDETLVLTSMVDVDRCCQCRQPTPNLPHHPNVDGRHRSMLLVSSTDVKSPPNVDGRHRSMSPMSSTDIKSPTQCRWSTSIDVANVANRRPISPQCRWSTSIDVANVVNRR